MKKQEMEQQVWQRVRAGAERPAETGLRQLQQEALELAAIYRALASRLTGKQQEFAQQLSAGEKANAAALAGIRILSRQGDENLKLWQPGKEEVKRTLEKCYHRTRRCMTEYVARSAENEFGIVFDTLAKRESAHCALVAELLGSLK